MNLIKPNNINFNYTGRIDFTNPLAPKFIYPGSMIKTKFQGTSVKLIAKNYHGCYKNYLGYIIDGKMDRVLFKENNKEVEFTLAEGLEDKLHDLIIYKREDSAHYFDFLGLVLDEECNIEKPAAKSNRRIECFGDSVSAGEICEAVDCVGSIDPENHNGEYSNSWYSYAMITARNFNAEINNNSQGGIAVLNGTGYFSPNYGYVGLESTYDKLEYNPDLGQYKKWDFNKYVPQVVIMALGQNDNNPSEYINEDKEKRENWKQGYKKIILDLRAKYPNALFIVLTTILMHNPGWDEALDEMVNEINDKKIVRFRFTRNGNATPGHPRIPEHEEMADELTKFISSFGEKLWKN